ncbi:MAG: hypothetical protein K2O40_04100 [Lachnospiraceae bacterium]|nr:hypothetical protein [Lachnospiraceae bacterium]MDE7183661.1 hypothetical protein [Lachnospiraceae bacterium]
MGVSLYYTANRSTPATPQEQRLCDEIAQRYDEQYPYGDLYEGFCIYDWESCQDDQEDVNVILQGATKLPIDDLELFQDVLGWWLDCLAELKGVLPDAQWDVSLDDVNFEWSEEKHCFLPQGD